MSSADTKRPVIRVGFSSERISPTLGFVEPDLPPYPTIRELNVLLTSFQQAVYRLVVAQVGLPSTQNLTADARSQFALLVISYEIRSWHSILQPVSELAGVWSAALTTIQVFHALGSGETTKEHASAAAVLKPLAAMVKEGIRKNRQVVATIKMPDGTEVSFQSTPEVANRIMDLGAQNSYFTPLGPSAIDGSARTQTTLLGGAYWYNNGKVLTNDPAHRRIYVLFPEYTGAIPCDYHIGTLSSLTDIDALQHLGEGHIISVRGFPERNPDDRPDMPPRIIRMVDFSGIDLLS